MVSQFPSVKSGKKNSVGHKISCDSSGGTEMMEYFSPKKNGRPNFFTNPGEIEKKFGEVPHDQQCTKIGLKSQPTTHLSHMWDTHLEGGREINRVSD